MKELFTMLDKRKSVRSFDSSILVSQTELDALDDYIKNLTPLYEDIHYEIKVVKREEITAKFGEYAVLFYTEERNDNTHLHNAGYILEQLDLYLELNNMGACWYGFGKTSEKTLNGLKFIIMLVFGKSAPEEFRTDISQFKRKDMNNIWDGEFDENIKTLTRLAPSAVNSQPWFYERKGDTLNVYRKKDIKAVLTAGKFTFLNSIDMGIALCFMDICLQNQNIYDYKRELIGEEACANNLFKIARYSIKPKVN